MAQTASPPTFGPLWPHNAVAYHPPTATGPSDRRVKLAITSARSEPRTGGWRIAAHAPDNTTRLFLVNHRGVSDECEPWSDDMEALHRLDQGQVHLLAASLGRLIAGLLQRPTSRPTVRS